MILCLIFIFLDFIFRIYLTPHDQNIWRQQQSTMNIAGRMIRPIMTLSFKKLELMTLHQTKDNYCGLTGWFTFITIVSYINFKNYFERYGKLISSVNCCLRAKPKIQLGKIKRIASNISSAWYSPFSNSAGG